MASLPGGLHDHTASLLLAHLHVTGLLVIPLMKPQPWIPFLFYTL